MQWKAAYHVLVGYGRETAEQQVHVHHHRSVCNEIVDKLASNLKFPPGKRPANRTDEERFLSGQSKASGSDYMTIIRSMAISSTGRDDCRPNSDRIRWKRKSPVHPPERIHWKSTWFTGYVNVQSRGQGFSLKSSKLISSWKQQLGSDEQSNGIDIKLSQLMPCLAKFIDWLSHKWRIVCKKTLRPAE